MAETRSTHEAKYVHPRIYCQYNVSPHWVDAERTTYHVGGPFDRMGPAPEAFCIQPANGRPYNVVLEFDQPLSVNSFRLEQRLMYSPEYGLVSFELYAWGEGGWSGEPLVVAEEHSAEAAEWSFATVRTDKLRLRVWHGCESVPSAHLSLAFGLDEHDPGQVREASAVPHETPAEREMMESMMEEIALLHQPTVPYLDTVYNPQQGYLGYVQEFADTMLEEGRDRYGEEHTPLFAAALSARTHRIPALCIPHGPHSRYRDRVPGGSCFNYDGPLLYVLDKLTEMTGQEEYSAAGQAYLEYFVENCYSETTGLFYWGTHQGWDLWRDAPYWWFTQNHEYQPAIGQDLFDRMWAVNPERVEKAFAGMHLHMTAADEYDFCRHCETQRWEYTSPGGLDIIDRGGSIALGWCMLYTKTGNEQYLEWARGLVNHFWRNRRDYDLPPVDTSRDVSVTHTSYHFTLALKLWEAGRLTKDPEIQERAGVFLFAPLRMPHQYDEFLICENWDFDNPAANRPVPPSAKTGRLCARAYALVPDPEMLIMLRTIARSNLETYLPGRLGYVTPRECGMLLGLMLDAWELERDEAYLAKAQRVAQDAVSLLYREGLFMATSQVEYYEVHSGAAMLVYELLRLHTLLAQEPHPLTADYVLTYIGR